jgi:4-amino-4-deoxy-L-arabinose transferase-like glycosyltransferase
MLRSFLRWRGDEIAVFVLSIAAGLAYTLSHSSLSIPHGPLVAGVSINDARMWDDAALVFASGSGYNMPHRPGYPILLGAAYALFGVWHSIPLILNLLAFGGTSLLVYKSAFALFDRATAIGAVGLLQTDVLRLGYLQVSNTDTVGCFLTASFVYSAFVLLRGRERSILLFFAVGLLLGLANLVKTMTLPAIGVVAIYVATSDGIRGPLRKSLAIALVAIGVLTPLAPWNAFRQQTQGAAELTEKGAMGLFLATSPTFNVDGNVDRKQSTRLRSRGFEEEDPVGTIADNLRNHWGAYIRNVFLATHKSFDTLHFGGHGSSFVLSVGFILVLAARWSFYPARRPL